MRGLHIADERRLAGQVAAALYLTAGITGLALLVMPGAEVAHPWVVVAVGGAALLWGTVALEFVPWERSAALVSHLSSFMGLPATAILVAETGGATSPARFYLLFIVFFCSWFYPPRQAAGYLALCAVAHSLPLLYDADPVGEGFLAELIVIVPIYVVLGGLVGSAKARLVRRREQSDLLSLTDPLTGAANRRAFEAALASRVGGSRVSDATGLLFVDLDDFKSANTLFGHAGGDTVLCRTSDALREAARGDDLVARLGGDEFAIIVGGVTEDGMRRVADRVLSCVQRADQELKLPGFRLNVSIGWALYPHHAGTSEELLEHADFALSGAKASGKGRWQAAVPKPVPSAP